MKKSKKLKKITQLITILLFSFVVNHLNAKETTLTVIEIKPNIQVGNSLQIDDSPISMDLSLLGTSTGSDPDYVIMREVEVALVYDRGNKSDVMGKYWRYRVHYELSYPTSNLPKETGFVELQFEPGEGIYEELKVYEEIPSTAILTITKVEGYDASNGTWNTYTGTNTPIYVPNDIRLELRMNVEYYERLDVLSMMPSLDINHSLTGTNNEKLLITWKEQIGAEEYELEYTFVDNEVLNTTIVDKWEKAVRVRTSDLYYEFDLVYPEGTLYYRVRCVGRHIQTAVNGDYSPERINSWSADKSVVLSGFESGKSWQSVVSYAEAGKRKQVVSYFDESMRSRQTQTYLSTEELTLVAETDYDVEGRSSVSILPAPAFENGVAVNDLSFKVAFNVNTDATPKPYSYRDFDKLSGANALGTTSGAGYYYSSANQIVGTNGELMYNEYMGDANGYPITQVQMLHDGTGRAWKQGGIGDFYQIGTPRATQYAYGTPNDTELRRLFGKDVGDASHYKKTLVKDANDQVSVSYIDQAGQVIATALAGASPDNVLALDSQVPVGQGSITADLSMTPTITPTAGGLVARTENVLLNTLPNQWTEYTFNYDLTGTTNYIESLDYCDKCDYEVSIKILKPNGEYVSNIEILSTSNTYINNTGTTNQSEISATYLGTTNPTCTTGVAHPYQNGLIEFKAEFYELGNYRVIKEVRVPNPDLAALQQELEGDGLLPDLQYYIDSMMQNIDTLMCEFDDSTYCAQWVIQNQPNLTGAALQAAIDSCMAAVNIASDPSQAIIDNVDAMCASGLLQIELQMSPGGVYYEEVAANGWSSIANMSRIVDHNISQLVPSPLYFNPYLTTTTPLFTVIDTNGVNYTYTATGQGSNGGFQFVDDNGIGHNSIYIYSQTPTSIGSHAYTLSASMSAFEGALFTPSLWQSQWADGLAYSHPEYCHYRFCDVKKASAEFDIRLSLYTTWSEAIAAEGFTITSCPSQSGTDIVDIDPYFVSIAPNDASLMRAAISNGGFNTNGDDICSLVNDAINVHPDWSLLASGSTELEEVKWRLFRGMYTDYKHRLLKTYQETAGCYFIDEDDAVFPSRPKEIDYDQAEAIVWANDQIEDMCGGLCEGQVAGWITQINDFLTVYCGDTLTTGDESTIEGLLSTYCLENCGVGNPLAELLTEDVLDGDLNQVISIIAPYTNGGCLDEDNNPVTGTTIITNISLSSNVIYTPVLDGNGNPITMIDNTCFLAAIEAFNTHILPSSAGYTTTYNAVGTSLESCFSSIEYSGGYFYIHGINQCPGNNGHPLRFTLNYNNGNQINPNNIAYLYNLTYHPTPPGTIPPASTYSNIKLTVDRINNPTPVNLYLHFYKEHCYPITASSVMQPVDFFTETINIDSLNCVEELIALAESQAEDAWQLAVNERLSAYLQENNCLEAPFEETFNVTYNLYEHHYTLYYYDQSGSLVQTVPPEGVKPLGNSSFNAKGEWNGVDNPNHKLKTNYRYNTIGGVTYQYSPDGGTTEFYYDRVGRIRFSQNENQRADNNNPQSYYSYTKYDEQGRIIEVGELDLSHLSSSVAFDEMEDNIDNPNYPDALQQTVSQVTKTMYDEAGQATFQQDNLRGRVSQVSNDNITTAYSYDIHGNVKELRHEVPNFGQISLEYDYDLVSGNVKEVVYQKGKLDEFHHKYSYDADNRIRQVYTSEYGRVWDNDATYHYYAHGPLARIELGNDDIQGLDYYYTLQGWIKGVNMPGDVAGQYDLGHDGNHNLSGNNNKYFARDEYAYALGYHEKDYTPIGAGYTTNPLQLAPTIENGRAWTDMDANIRDRNYGSSGSVTGLFNGNIAYMLTDLPKLGQQGISDRLNGMTYQYDALHRIRYADSHKWTGSSWGGDNGYNTKYTYDANGNIKSLVRSTPNFVGGPMDELSYIYDYDVDGDLKHNKLLYVNDNVNNTPAPGTNNYLGDMQGNTAYTYDEIGNLVSEDMEYIEEIKWNVQGKVDAVLYNSMGISQGRKNLSFTYDASGNRLTKRVESEEAQITYYMRDASGNVMMVYKAIEVQNEFFKYREINQEEAHLYGSSRLGIKKYSRHIAMVQIPNGEIPEEEQLGQLVEDLRISEVNYDSPMTPDNGITEIHTGEYIALYNVSLEPMDLSDVVIEEKGTGIQHPITDGTTLQSGQTLLFAYGTPADQADFLKANNLENKVDPNHVLWYWQTDIVLSDNGETALIKWQHPIEQDEVLIDYVDFGLEPENTAANVYYDITSPSGEVRPSVMTLRRDLTEQIERRQTMYDEFGLADMYFAHLNARLDQTLTQQLQYLEENQQEGWEFNPEVAQGEITTAFYANYENAYVPHAPEDYTLSPYQWYNAANNSQSSTTQSGTVTYNTEPFKYRRERGQTYYELSNHLGNVLVTVTDMKIGIEGGTNWVAQYYEATVVSAVDYYPFGSSMAGRKFNDNSYRYGFNGQEEDPEWKGGAVVFKYRIHDARIGKFLSVDPLAPEYPWNSTYACTENSVIAFIELEGLERVIPRIFIPRPILTFPKAPTISIPSPPKLLPPVPMTTRPGISQYPTYPKLDIKLDFESAIDWTKPPSSPSSLGEEWEEVTHPDNKSGSRDFQHKETKEKIRWDPGKDGKSGWEGKDHWHRYNPNKTGKGDYYLDRLGNIVRKGSNASHIGTESYLQAIPGLIKDAKNDLKNLQEKRNKLSLWNTDDWDKIYEIWNQMDEVEEYIDDLESYQEEWKQYEKKKAEYYKNCDCMT